MTTIPDLIKDFIETSKERLKTPISGAFLWSFIIWNWRPIFLLMFSDASIEDKIVVINNEYCNVLAIIFPIFIALFYTLLIPKIMVEINKELAPTKNKRVDDIYDSKEHVTQRKIDLADKIFELKNKESGNKQIQDYLDEIESLKEKNAIQQESIKELNDTNISTISELTSTRKALNNERSERYRSSDQYKFDNLDNIIVDETIQFDEDQANEIRKAGEALTFDEFIILKSLEVNENKNIFFGTGQLNLSILKNLSEKKILHYKDNNGNYEVAFTQLGLILTSIIKKF